MTDLEDAPLCPGCGCEAEIETYYVEQTEERKRIGYHCACSAMVQYGVVVGYSNSFARGGRGY